MNMEDRKRMDNFEQKLDDIHKSVKDIQKELFGTDYRDGMIPEVRKNIEFRQRIENREEAIKWMLGGGWFFSFIAIIVTLLGVFGVI